MGHEQNCILLLDNKFTLPKEDFNEMTFARLEVFYSIMALQPFVGPWPLF
jgi:hypothetical protein